MVLCIVPVLHAATYTQYKECTLYDGSCDDFAVNFGEKTISFSFTLKNFYEYQQTIIGIREVRLEPSNSNYNYRYGGMGAGISYDRAIINTQPAQQSLCQKVYFGTSKDSLKINSVGSDKNTRIYVEGRDCDMTDGGWLRGSIIIVPVFESTTPKNANVQKVAQNAGIMADQMVETSLVSPNSYQHTISGTIIKYVEGPKAKERAAQENVVRFIPLVVIVGISLLGLIRVKR
jgi:hypothetical protein